MRAHAISSFPAPFPSLLHPDVARAYDVTAANTRASALLASARSYLPSLEHAKAYLPDCIAAYLPSSESPSTASAPVDVGARHHRSVHRFRARALTATTNTNTSSITVAVGHGVSVPYAESGQSPIQSSFTSSTYSGPGLAGLGAGVSFSSSPAHPTTACMGHPASMNGVAPRRGCWHRIPASMPMLASSEPGESNERALPTETQHPVSSPLFCLHPTPPLDPSRTSMRTTSPPLRPLRLLRRRRPILNPGLLPSHPAAGPQSHFNAHSSTQTRAGNRPNVHTPHKVWMRRPDSSRCSSSLFLSFTTDSAYTASSESDLASPSASSTTQPGSTFPPFVGDLGLPGSARVRSSAALNSSRLVDVVPTRNFDNSPHHLTFSHARAASRKEDE
ncbi:hypothetical protein B0H16DRAFT_1742602 [Mycena metata]|uniref:Uncharacterized protein n=1 Tax=Mycena metata TaxID=1033252 RepID=A0AAD7MFJ0_9AGAR|nr:hypothetical protein B0H16DRAFT_1742602 [Mycena metata]